MISERDKVKARIPEPKRMNCVAQACAFTVADDRTVAAIPITVSSLDNKRLSDDDADLAGSGAFHKLDRGLKQLEILLVLSRLGAVDLYPFPGASHTARLKRDDVAP